jgi:DNA replicative helicase MCM subunit Mcm2 (Cdc46/Mcm family)
MVGKIITGETVKVSGVIKTETLDEKDKKTQGIFIPYVLANNLTQKYNNNVLNYDFDVINDMKANPNIFYSLLKSYCPTIYGH